MNTDELLRVAEEAARAAAAVLLEHWAAGPRDVQTKSGPLDFVSAADHAAERAVRDVLARERPDDGVLGEEGGETESRTGLRWVVDPLDGTVNFLRRVPHWCVSVGCEDATGSVAGVVADPLREEWFTATRGGGASCNGTALSASGATDASLAMVGGEYAVRRPGEEDVVRRFVSGVGYVRNLGSSALDLAWAAAGRWDAVFLVRHPSPWDIAAGRLLCAEAGLSVERVGLAGGGDGLLVAPPALREGLLPLVSGRRSPEASP